MPHEKLTARFVQSPRLRTGDYWDTLLPGFGLRVLPSRKKRWMVLFKRSRRGFASYPAWSLGKARKHAEGLLRTIEQAKDPFREPEKPTLAVVSALFLEKYAEPRHSKQWLREQKWALSSRILPRFGDQVADEVGRLEIAAWLDEVAATAPIMANRLRAMLSNIYNWALRRELVVQNPIAGLAKAVKERTRERVLTEEEICRVVLACREDGTLFAKILELMLLTAQRGKEVREMTWDQIDGSWWTIPVTKNGRSHRVFLSRQAREVLRSVPRLHQTFVFPAGRSPGASRPAQKNSNGPPRIRQRCGVADWRPHDLRRTAATLMASQGVSPFIIERVLGHTDRRGVTAIYDRWSYEPEIRQALTLLGDRVEAVVSREPSSEPLSKELPASRESAWI